MLANLAIPLQLVCQLVAPGSYESTNSTLVLNAPISSEPATLPDGYHAFPDIGVAYKYYNDTRTWNMARKTCIAHNSTLAVIDSFKKSGYVQSIKIGLEWGVFVGIHRLFGNSEWVSVNDGKMLIWYRILPVNMNKWSPQGDDILHSDVNSDIFDHLNPRIMNSKRVMTACLPVKSIPWAPTTLEEDEKNNCLSLWNDGRGVAAIPCENVRNFVCEIPLHVNLREPRDATLDAN